jgi:hypothetical protein
MANPEFTPGELSNHPNLFKDSATDIRNLLSQKYTQTYPSLEAKEDILRLAAGDILFSTFISFFRDKNYPEDFEDEKEDVATWYEAVELAAKGDWSKAKEKLLSEARLSFGSAAAESDILDSPRAQESEQKAEWLLNLARSLDQ